MISFENYYWAGQNLLISNLDNAENFFSISEDLFKTEEVTYSLAPSKIEAQVQVLEKDTDSFCLGIKVPNSLLVKCIESLPEHFVQKMEPVKHPHIFFTLPSSTINPSILVKNIETLSNALEMSFIVFTITGKGSVHMLAIKHSDYDKYVESLAQIHQTKVLKNFPQSRIGKLDTEMTQKLFENPEHYGFAYLKSYGILVRKVEDLSPFQVIQREERPNEQRLLALSYGEQVNYTEHPLQRSLELEERFRERNEAILKEQARVIEMFARDEIPKCPTYNDPLHFNAQALRLATEGHYQYGRVPLIFSMKAPTIREGVQMWVSFRWETSVILVNNGYDDSHVSVLGSGVNGYSGNPNKPLKAWTPNSDVDCAIFSTKLASQMLEKDGWVNCKVTMKGKYIVFKNSGNSQLKKSGFYHLPVGEELKALSLKWTRILFGEPGTEKPQIKDRPVEIIAEDEVDFKLNIEDFPFEGVEAITFRALDHIHAPIDQNTKEGRSLMMSKL